MRAKCYAQGFAVAHSDRDPEVIDVTRDFVGFRGEGDRCSRHAHKLSLSPPRLRMLTALAVSMWQSKIEYGHLSHLSSGESYARLAERPSQSQAHGRRGDLNCKLRL